MRKRPADITPGDPLLTPDRRRWRVSRVDRFPGQFLAEQPDRHTVLAASLDRLVWSDVEQAWVLQTDR